MDVIIAPKSGFCFGVRRAIKAAEDAPKGKLFSLGEIIHNRHVVQELEKKGVKKIDGIDELLPGDTVIIRSHGEPPKVFDALKEKGIKIIDATCPYVRAAQNHGKLLKRQGYEVIIIGTPGHPEVIGLAGHSESKKIISGAEEIDEELLVKTAIIAQTTVSRKVFEKVVKKIKEIRPDAVAIDTICSATKERQESAIDLAGKVDMMIVVGGKQSSNTAKLAELCKKKVITHLVEGPEDLDLSWFEKISIVGIAGGASTPKRIINETVEKIKKIDTH